MPSIRENIVSIQKVLQERCAASVLAKQPPLIIGASKTQPPEVIEEAIGGGLICFGENRVQDAMAKWPAILSRHPNVRLHLIGPLQSNKTKEAVALFHVIQTIDRPAIAQAIRKECDKQGRNVECFIQVNTGEEPQKAGVMPGEADTFIEYCRNEVGLTVTGLMCIPPADQNPAPHFALLYAMAKRHGLSQLSMGMSSDYAVAAQMGATFVRIGTAIFGERRA